MAKNSIRDFSATAGSNTDIQSVNIDENCPASGINNAIRELMVDLKNVSTGAVNLETPAVDQLNFGDNAKAQFGNSQDLQIFHDASSNNSIIAESGSGDLRLQADDLYVFNAAGNSVMISALDTGKVGLGFSGSEKLATTSTGVDVTGVITTDGLTTSADISVADNIKAKWGTGNDLHIYHDGADSYIQEHGSGSLYIGADSTIALTNAAVTTTKAQFITGGAVKLFYNNAQKFQTTSSGATVGTTSSSGANNGLLIINNGGTGDAMLRFDYENSGDRARIGVTSSGQQLEFYTAGDNERMRIDSSGNILHGTGTQVNAAKYVMEFDRVPNTGMTIENTNGTSATQHMIFRNSNGNVGSITVSGSSTAFNTSSDHRLKQGVEDMTGAIDRVKALAPKRFQFIADADTTVDGFLAHEAQAVVPEAVTGTKDEVDDDGNAVMQGIDQSKLVPLLTGALQEAIAKIETLETKVAALEA